MNDQAIPNIFALRPSNRVNIQISEYGIHIIHRYLILFGRFNGLDLVKRFKLIKNDIKGYSYNIKFIQITK